jgi:hypothetical protein
MIAVASESSGWTINASNWEGRTLIAIYENYAFQ